MINLATRVSVSFEDKVAYLTFSEENERRPCTLDWDVLKELRNAVSQIEDNIPDTRLVIVQSASPKSFIVGANIAALEELNPENIMEWVRQGHDVFLRLRKLPIPVIAKVESYALGGGLELAMACDFIVATENAVFAQPEASLGVMPGWGGSFRLINLVGPNRAKQLFMTGEHISAKQAYEWGLVNLVCSAEEIDEKLNEIAEKIVQNDYQVLAFVKRMINNISDVRDENGILLEEISSSVCLNSESTKARLNAFFEKRRKK